MNNLNIKEYLLKKYPEYRSQIETIFACSNPKQGIESFKNICHNLQWNYVETIFDMILKDYNNVKNMRG